MTMLSVRREVGEFRKRYKWMALLVVVTFVILLIRLIYLQLFMYDDWSTEAQKNITKRIVLPATRGIIRDTKGRPIATNRPAYDVFITPQLTDEEDLQKISKLMRLNQEQVADFKLRIKDIPLRRRSHLIKMFSDINRDQFAALQTHKRELTGLEVVAVPVRTYPFKALGAHAIGFLNEVNADDLKRFAERNYKAGDQIGRGGLESGWESYLRGRDGELKVVVDVRGREHNPIGVKFSRQENRRDPVAGRDLRITLDMDLMRIVERAFRGHPSGGAVVVEVQTGKVRALFSKPSYDLNEMSGGISQERLIDIESNPFRPLIDKAVYETYFPGSTFKPISAIAALQDGILTSQTRFECPGYYELGRRRFHCSHVHNEVDMRKAIVQSCNVYFYQLAEQVGIDRLARFAKDFGLGAKTGIGVNSEAAGFIPTREWYLKRYNNKYRIGFTVNEAIGQGNKRVTLMQMVMAYAAIANGGTLYVPQLVEAVEAPDGEVIENFEPRVRRRVNVDREHLTFIVDALFGVVNDPQGTAFEERLENSLPMAGKTGTAQVAHRRLRPGEDPRRAWYYRRSHAWFVGFAPAPDPRYAVAVLVEHGGRGGKYAAPIAFRILHEALGGDTR